MTHNTNLIDRWISPKSVGAILLALGILGLPACDFGQEQEDGGEEQELYQEEGEGLGEEGLDQEEDLDEEESGND
ncbi:MAG: hypothetical protein ACFCVD_06070 [Nodosilinea sp.]